MIKILVVDDNIDKIKNIISVINEKCTRSDIEIETAVFAIDAKKILSSSSVDILVLDICLPERAGSELRKDEGIRLLKQINESTRYSYPRFVIALSEYQELTKKFDLDAGIIHSSLVYNTSTNEWKLKLSESIDKAISIISNNVTKRSYNYDVAVICALKEELDLVKSSLDSVKDVKITDDDYIYFEGTFVKDAQKRRVIMAQSTHMGMVPAATLTTRMIYNFTPKYVVMTGIAAGIKGKANFGDVICAEYTWDYGAGKDALEGSESVHRNTIQQISIDTDMLNMVRRISVDDLLLHSIKKDFIGEKPDCELRIILGPVASGASVVANPQIVENIKNGQIRDTVGIEMEIFGVYYAARWSIYPKPKFLAIKSVCDYADVDKNDVYHAYASYTSARTFIALAKDYFEYDF